MIMKLKAIIAAAVAGTTVMTAFSYLISGRRKKSVREPELLGSLTQGLFPSLKNRKATIAGWELHYFVGLSWTFFYALLQRKYQEKFFLQRSLPFGAFSGTVAILCWMLFFKSNPNPPRIHYPTFFRRLFIAHFPFSIIMIRTYLKMTDNTYKNSFSMAANDRITYMAPEISCLADIHKKGFTDEFKPSGFLLRCLDNGKTYSPSQISVVNFYRFEGVSDPDDMSIIYVIQTDDGRKGTLIDAYGFYADEEIGNFMIKVEDFHKQTSRGWS
jgi:hypothetical protein